MHAIQTENLSKTFESRPAIRDLTFSVHAGEVFGFLGPNGAGKTTTIRLLTGQIEPTSGRASVAGWDISTQAHRLKGAIGVVFERQNLYERMTGRENLMFFARLYELEPGRVDELLQLSGLGEHARRRVQHYSNGMKQRLSIARA